MQQDPNPAERIVEEACSQGGFEFNDLQKFWNSLLGIATMGTNLVFAFLTTILAVSKIWLKTKNFDLTNFLAKNIKKRSIYWLFNWLFHLFVNHFGNGKNRYRRLDSRIFWYDTFDRCCHHNLLCDISNISFWSRISISR